MENCTICPFVRYWYVILAVAIVAWAVYRFMQTRNEPVAHPIPGVENLTGKTFDAELGKGIVLVDFWAPWCGPCKRQIPIIEEIVKELPPGVRIAKVNVDLEQELAQRFQVQTVPTWIVWKDGREIRRVSGLRTKEELRKLFENTSKQ